MSIEVKVPPVGESITEGTLARWLKKDGEMVREGDPIFELETDKATGEVPSPASGRLRPRAKEGATVEIGAVVALIEPARTDGGVQPPQTPVPTPHKTVEPRPVETPVPTSTPIPKEPAVPVLQPRATEHGRTEVISGQATVKRETRKPLSRIRKTIAERLVAAQHTAAILTTFNECDMSQVLAIRSQYKESFEARHRVRLGLMSFFIKASIEALKAFPMVNARIDGGDIVEQHFYDIGVAVSTDRGLLVPVVRDAEWLTFAEVEKAVEQYSAKAREGKIALEDLQGGTFTITNGGVFGSLLSTPILNPPQSGILAMHTIQKRAVVVDDQIVIRPMMYLALSYDHRLIDGREAVKFLVKVKDCIENPLGLVWGL
jgi:2-oxoglutarate dehydrogenase E2 component (dihydrolipoamide succinyltransferase)